MDLERENTKEKTNKNQLFSTENESTHKVDLTQIGFDAKISQTDTQEKPANPEDFFKSENDTLVKNIVNTKISSEEAAPDGEVKQNQESFLKEFQDIDQRLNLQIESLQSVKAKQKKFKLIFLVSLLLAATALFASLFYQNKINLSEQNIETPLTTSQNQLNTLNSNLILNQTKQISLLMNKLAFQASDFNRDLNISRSDFENISTKNISASNLSKKQEQIVQTLNQIKQVLPKAQSIYNSSPEFQASYTNFLSESLSKEEGSESTLFSSKQLIQDSSKILTNKDLATLISSEDYSQLTQTDLLKLLKQIFNASQLNYVTEISQQSLNRTDLTLVFSELNKVATEFDPNFSAFNINPDSQINFNSYTINANDMVNVNADIKSSEAKLFSLIANLDDAISDTKMFQKIERTNYSQNINPNGEFTSSVSLDIKLNTE